EVTLDLAVAPRKEIHNRLDVASVVVRGDVVDAGSLAALDVVVETGIARCPPRFGALAGPIRKQLAEQVDTEGRAVVLTTTREHAELKRDQIHAYGKDAEIAECQGSMWATIEAEL
ncbi:hypothetical protein LCGC14_3099870, partial [marine sediment metagenome]